MAQKLESGPMNIHHGHTDTQVLVQFSRPVDHVLLTPQQAKDLVAAIQGSMAKLAEHQATGKKLLPHG